VRFFRPNVDKLSLKQDVAGLIEALGDGDREIRVAAGEALVKIGAPAREALVGALRSKSSTVRQSAAAALGDGRVRATAALAAALKEDQNAAVRAAAARAIGQIRDTEGSEALIAALADAPEVNEAARESLLHIGAPSVLLLTEALRHEKPRVRESAAALLEEIADPRAFKALLEAMQDSDPAVVRSATLAVERFRRVQDGLEADLLNPTLDVRRSVAKALDELGWEPEQDEYGAAYWAAQCRWDECLRIGPPAVKPLIRAILGIARPGENREEERRAAAQTLGALGKPAIHSLLKAAEIAHYPDDTDALLITLSFVRDPDAVEDLIEVVTGNRYGQQFAARALAKIGDARAVKPLADAVVDSGRLEDQRIEAAMALGEFRDPRAVEPLLAVLKHGAHRPDLEAAAVAALAAIADRRACATVIEAMFRHPRNDYAWQPWSEALRSLFTDFTDLLVDLAGFVVVDSGEHTEVLGYRDEVFWTGSTIKFIVERNRAAIDSLCSSQTPTTTNLLHEIKNTLALKSNYPGAAAEFNRDFSALKELAANELTRRGDPPYDPSVYLEAAAWKRSTPED
jgi:HEAT repeat protein